MNNLVVIESNENLIITDFIIKSKIAIKNFAFTRINNKINKILNEIVVEFNEEVRYIVIFKQISFKFAFQNIAIDNSQQQTLIYSIIFALSINEFSNNVNKLNINISFLNNIADVNTSILNIVSFHTIEYIQQKILKQNFYLRSRRDFFVNFLTLFVKCFFSNFYKFKNYNEVIIDINYKKDWKLVINDEMQSFKNNKIWKLINSIFKNRKILINK